MPYALARLSAGGEAPRVGVASATPHAVDVLDLGRRLPSRRRERAVGIKARAHRGRQLGGIVGRRERVHELSTLSLHFRLDSHHRPRDRPPMHRWRAHEGQAAVELVAVIPIVIVLAAALWQAVVAGQAVWVSGAAARAAARAAAVGGDAEAAARRAPPGGLGRGT